MTEEADGASDVKTCYLCGQSAPDSCFRSERSSDSSRSRSEPIRGETLQNDLDKSRRIERKRRRARSWTDAGLYTRCVTLHLGLYPGLYVGLASPRRSARLIVVFAVDRRAVRAMLGLDRFVSRLHRRSSEVKNKLLLVFR